MKTNNIINFSFFFLLIILGIAGWIFTLENQTNFNATNLTGKIKWNLSATGDDGFRSITWDYNYGGKEWKYFTMMNAACHQVQCECAEWGCLAYCIEG